MNRLAALLFVGLGWALIAPQAVAARIISAEIALLEGRVVLLASTRDDGKADEETVWRYLKHVTFGGGRGVAIRPDPDNPLQATLKGPIDVQIEYGGKARLEQLKLIRANKDGLEWRIDPQEVERMLKIRKPW